jgi:hypothetical protein
MILEKQSIANADRKYLPQRAERKYARFKQRLPSTTLEFLPNARVAPTGASLRLLRLTLLG